MEGAALLFTVLTAAALAAALSVAFTAPPSCILPTFICGFATFLVRAELASAGVPDGWATAAAAAAAVLVGVVVTPRRLPATVVIIAAIFPLSAGVALFGAMNDLLRVSYSQNAQLQEAWLSLAANLGRAVTTFGALAFGLEVGITIVRTFRRRVDI